MYREGMCFAKDDSIATGEIEQMEPRENLLDEQIEMFATKWISCSGDQRLFDSMLQCESLFRQDCHFCGECYNCRMVAAYDAVIEAARKDPGLIDEKMKEAVGRIVAKRDSES